METAALEEAEPCTWAGLEEMRPELRQALSRYANCRADIDDVVQEALLRAARFRHRLSDTSRLRPWVTRIAVNVMRDVLRRDMRMPRIDAPDELFARMEGREEIPGDSPDDEMLEAEGIVFERAVLIGHLECSMAELPRADRRVLRLWYSHHERRRPASRVCESAPELAKVQVFRARSRLSRILRKRLALAHPASTRARTERRDAQCVVGLQESKNRGPHGAARNQT
ncbi:MAG: sigma-70 family RNA polymerase sigma factor [Planctomycetes bacterium]|nr:sigma-70 family RNA polymerase sigma factor [Planctomycetota bacterium]